jgi:hypothetical protein
MCTVLLPPGGYPIAVKYIISYIVSKWGKFLAYFSNCYLLKKNSTSWTPKLYVMWTFTIKITPFITQTKCTVFCRSQRLLRLKGGGGGWGGCCAKLKKMHSLNEYNIKLASPSRFGTSVLCHLQGEQNACFKKPIVSVKLLFTRFFGLQQLRCWHYYHHYNHHHLSVMELGHLLTRSGLTYPEVSSKVCHDSSAIWGILYIYICIYNI